MYPRTSDEIKAYAVALKKAAKLLQNMHREEREGPHFNAWNAGWNGCLEWTAESLNELADSYMAAAKAGDPEEIFKACDL